MIEDIKKDLINHPDKLQEVLEVFGYCHIVIHTNYMQFGRDEVSSKKSIVIRLENNPYLFVTDYARNINKDLFGYICDQRNVEFVEVLNTIKGVLGISDYYSHYNHKGIFGGFYDKIHKNSTFTPRTYDEDILDEYEECGNQKFLADHISLATQRYFAIGYDTNSQSITIPIRNQVGELMGVKARRNYDLAEEDFQKYYYLVPCSMSATLFGYSQNYQYLVENTVYVFESEKSVMQCHSYGIRNAVAMGSGSISKKHIQMLYELKPKKIIFMHDEGYPKESIARNIDALYKYNRFSEVEIGYWDYTLNNSIGHKMSPTDMGKDFLLDVIKNEIKFLGDDSE